MAIRTTNVDNFLLRTSHLPSITTYTLMLWVRHAGKGTSSGAHMPFIYRNNGAADSQWVGVYFYDVADLTITGLSADSTLQGQIDVVPLQSSSWLHITLTKLGSRYTVWQNAEPYITWTDATAITNTRLYIGGNDFTAESAIVFDYADLKIWSDVALTPTEMRREMMQVFPARIANLHTFAPLWTPNDLRDYHQYGSAFTITGTLGTSVAHLPIPLRVNAGRGIYEYARSGDTQAPQFWARSRRQRPPFRASAVAETTLTVVPVTMIWQASSPQLVRTVVIYPAQVESQVNVLRLTRTLPALGAKMVWAVRTLVLSRQMEVRQAQVRWQVTTLPRIMGVLPVRMMWRVSLATWTRQVSVSPANLQWRVGTLPRIAVLRPVQLQWSAQPLQLRRTLLVTIARMQWRTSILPRLLVTRPAQLQWAAGAAPLTRGLLVSPAQVVWQAPRLPRILVIRPAQVVWRAQSGVAETADTTTLTTAPAQVRWRGQMPTLTGRVLLTPVQVRWHAQTPIQSRMLTSQPVRVQWRGQTPVLSRVFRLMPPMTKWQAGLLTVPRIIRVAPAQEVWHAQALRHNGVLTVHAARMQWRAHSSYQSHSYYPFRQDVWRWWRY